MCLSTAATLAFIDVPVQIGDTDSFPATPELLKQALLWIAELGIDKSTGAWRQIDIMLTHDAEVHVRVLSCGPAETLCSMLQRMAREDAVVRHSMRAQALATGSLRLDDDAFALSRRADGSEEKLAALLTVLELALMQAVCQLETQLGVFVIPRYTVPVMPSQPPGEFNINRGHAGATERQLTAAMARTKVEAVEGLGQLGAADRHELEAMTRRHNDVISGDTVAKRIVPLCASVTHGEDKTAIAVADVRPVSAAQQLTEHGAAAQRMLELRACTVSDADLLHASRTSATALFRLVANMTPGALLTLSPDETPNASCVWSVQTLDELPLRRRRKQRHRNTRYLRRWRFYRHTWAICPRHHCQMLDTCPLCHKMQMGWFQTLRRASIGHQNLDASLKRR